VPVSASFHGHIPGKHIPEDMLDEFVMEMLPEQDYVFWEEHLLICPTCQDRLAQADEYVRLIKTAAAELQARSLYLSFDSEAVGMAGDGEHWNH
jgi:hypothetical protein